jgi:P27 family predicted phage terminase small subunit
MGRRGPAPKPTKLRLLHGDRKDRVNTSEPLPAEGLPECPDSTREDVREVWDYTLDQLAAMGLATPADRDALYAYCEAVVLHREACRLVAKSGVLLRGIHGNPIRNPALQVMRDAAQVVRALAQEFGLTPSSRSQIVTTPESAAHGSGERLLS